MGQSQSKKLLLVYCYCIRTHLCYSLRLAAICFVQTGSVAPVVYSSWHPDGRRLEYDYTILFCSAMAHYGDG